MEDKIEWKEIKHYFIFFAAFTGFRRIIFLYLYENLNAEKIRPFGHNMTDAVLLFTGYTVEFIISTVCGVILCMCAAYHFKLSRGLRKLLLMQSVGIGRWPAISRGYGTKDEFDYPPIDYSD